MSNTIFTTEYQTLEKVSELRKAAKSLVAQQLIRRITHDVCIACDAEVDAYGRVPLVHKETCPYMLLLQKAYILEKSVFGEPDQTIKVEAPAPVNLTAAQTYEKFAAALTAAIPASDAVPYVSHAKEVVDRIAEQHARRT